MGSYGLERSTGYDVNSGQQTVSEHRTSFHRWFNVGSDPFLSQLERRISEMTGMPVDCGEGFQLAHYPPGTEFKGHHDYFHEEYEGSKITLARGGQRLLTFMIYLNTLPAGCGGETHFTNAGVKIRPEEGKALVFWNMMPNWQVDESTFHAGLPPAPGYEKWILNKWIRKERFV